MIDSMPSSTMTYTPTPDAGRRPPPRRVWFATADDTLRCGPFADDHRLEDPLVWNDGALRCRKRDAKSVAECGRLVYIIGGDLRTTDGKPMWALVHVTSEELRIMREQRMDWRAAVAYLGIGLLP